MLISSLMNLANPDLQSIEFHYSYKEKLKKLSGFQSGRHFLPKYHSKSLEDFVSGISLKDIEDQMLDVTDKLRGNLNLGVNDFTYDVSKSGGGLFECACLTLSIQCAPDPENLNEATHQTKLFLKKEGISRADKIFAAFSHSFAFARIYFAEALNLKEFIYQLEVFIKKETENCSYYYDPAIQYLEILFKISNKKIIMRQDHMDIYFTGDFSISDFIKLL
ncbi:MAG: hypothetical protein OEV66_08965 [Spirochaetia bacterium]|nr:hypothetical protein [Spirochaetia bacterium]